jgi:hypothetical protein
MPWLMLLRLASSPYRRFGIYYGYEGVDRRADIDVNVERDHSMDEEFVDSATDLPLISLTLATEGEGDDQS